MKSKGRRGITLLEVVLVIAIATLLLAILLPVLSATREHARQEVCLSNTHELALANALYIDDYDGMIAPAVVGKPARILWPALLMTYVHSREVFWCPSDPDRMRKDTSYARTYPHMAYRWPDATWKEDPSRVPGDPASFSIHYYMSPSHVMLLVDSDSYDPSQYIFSQIAYCATPGGTGPSAHPWSGDNIAGATKFGNITERHTGGASIAMLDGSAHFLQRNIIFQRGGKASMVLFGHLNE